MEQKRRSTTGGVIIGSSYDEARTRKMNADAEIAEMELAKIRQELCSTQDVIKAWADVLNACRAKFLALPTKIAPLVATEDDPAIVKDILEKQIHEALAEMANYDPSRNWWENQDGSAPSGGSAGALDDNPQAAQQVADSYLKRAIEALLANQAIAEPSNRAAGCAIRKK